MYSDKTEKGRGLLKLLPILIALLLILLFFARHPRSDLEDEGAAAVRAAVQRSALQCYAVEGVYPPDLQYLEDNYGLQVNTDDYYVTYEAFASNLPPDVKIIAKKK